MSKNIKCFSVSDGRIITYEPDPVHYGLLNHGVFAIYQKEKEIYTLFCAEAKHIKYVLEKNDHTLIIAGQFMEVNPYYAFVDAYQPVNNQILKKKIISDFINENWIIKNNIIYTQVKNINNNSKQYNNASYIEEISFNKIIVKQSTEEKELILKYNETTNLYEISKD